MAFHLTGLRNDQLMAAAHYREVERVTGVNFMEGSVSSRHEVEEDLSNSLKKETPLLRLITLARLKMNSLKDEYNLSDLDQPWIEVDYAANSLKAYKKKHGLFDYTDMLELLRKLRTLRARSSSLRC